MNKLFVTTLASWLLLFTGSIAAAQTTRALLADTPIRLAPNFASAIIATLKDGEPVDVIDVQGDWCRVLVPHGQGKPGVGYVLARLVGIVNREGSAQPIQAPPASRSEEPMVQRAAPPPSRLVEQRAPGSQPSARADHVRISVNVGTQPSSTTFAGSTTKVINVETAVINTTYGVGAGRSFDGGVLVMVVGHFAVGVVVSSFDTRQDATVAAGIPHLFFYNTPRPIAGTASGVERNELVTHFHAAYVISTRGKVDLALSGGPSLFRVKQDLVSDVTYTETYPYDTATFAAASSTTISVSKIGFNAGADVGVRLSKNVGVGGLVRFSRATIELTLPGAIANVKSTVGGVQVAGGLRLFF